MNKFKVLKRALRFHNQDENQHALLELNSLLSEYPELSAAHCVRARVLERKGQHPAAIVDYMRALSKATNLSKRNTMRIVQNVLVCASQLKAEEKVALATTLRDDQGLKDKFPNPDSWNLILTRGLIENVSEAQKRVLSTPAGVGRIANIGKFLLDTKDVEKLTQILSQKETASGYRTLTTYQCQLVTEESL